MAEKADIIELAVAAWRLEKWLDNLNADRKMAAKSALRIIKKYISACGIEVRDPIGARFDPGLAIEVVNNESEEAPEETLIITETLSPYIYHEGKLVQHAREIIGTTQKCVKENKGTVEVDDMKARTGDANMVENTESLYNLQAEQPSVDENITISKDEIERIKAYAKIL